MKKISAFFLVLILGCGSSKTGFQPVNVSLKSDCPKQANCTIEIIPNNRLVIEPTTLGDGIRYKLAEQTGKNVIIYKYNRIVKGNLQDAGYREEIVFEYGGQKDFTLKDDQLQDTKMLFGRFCYCKGQTGYYPVKQGQLLIDRDANAQLEFTVTEVPQIVKGIQFQLK